tara:strand:- start:199 stop:552 length:354 start_codon:yes stop_codon:yes gene_type:complete
MNNKLKLSALLLGGALSVNAQSDTTYVTVGENSLILESLLPVKKYSVIKTKLDTFYTINIGENDVLWLDLHTGKRKRMKIVTKYNDGVTIEQFLKSKNHRYETVKEESPLQVIIFTK